MAAVITRGQTFGSTDQVTNTKLHNLVDLATISGIDQTNVGGGIITVSATAPTTGTGFGWFDTSLGAGRGFLRIYDNGVWKAVAEGFIGYNGSGVTIGEGAPVVYDPTFSSGVTVGTVPIRRTVAPTSGAVQMDRPIGVAAAEIVNAATGVILTRGYSKAIKDAVSITAGDPLVPSITTNAQCTTGALGSWGYPEGSACFGRWLDTSAAAAGEKVAVFLTGPNGGSWVVFKNSGGTVIFNGSPTALATWQDATAFSTAPIGTVAHICQVRIGNKAAAFPGAGVAWTETNLPDFSFGLRAKNATITIDTGAAFMGGLCPSDSAGTPATSHYVRGQLIVQETTGASSGTAQIYLDSSGDTTASNWTIHVIEVGVIVGGQIV